ncbi:EAL domain, c-di-GMP-specific phosphodiesterase class I (or its enzymatically inactive variant) [Lachnospiraceae bacterium NE2001]|nr:EAL domain, c-di-GMP-specific phosphodiesterase class I (or its enzymatically inactive variant) [Lachnospiraceae bacterium NE2001]
MANTRERNKIKKKRMKDFKKVRNGHVFGSLVAYLLLMILFIFLFVLVGGYFVEYLLESKFQEEYNRLSTVAEIYEEGKNSGEVLGIISKTSNEYIITDSDGRVLHQNGSNTCSAQGETIYMSNGAEKFLVYKDTESDYIYPDGEGGLDIKWLEVFGWIKQFFKDEFYLVEETAQDELNDETEDKKDQDKDDVETGFSFKLQDTQDIQGIYVTYNQSKEKIEGIKDIDSILLPLWISIDAGDGENFIGKALFSFEMKDVVLVGEIAGMVIIIAFIFSIIMLVSLIKSIRRYFRVRNLFYKDFVTNGKNWNHYLIIGDKRIHGLFSKKNNWAAVNFVFLNYRNYCLCHSIPEGEELLANINSTIMKSIKNDEICAHATTSNFALLLKYDDELQLQQRLQTMVDELTHMEKDHLFSFQVGVSLLPAESNVIETETSEEKIPRKDIFIDDIYNNACAARAELADTDESGIRFYDKSLLLDQQWTDTVQERQRSAVENEEFQVYYQPKYNPEDNTLRGAEALIRWQFSPTELVSPGRFIPLFEKNGFITEIDHYMISHVARDQRAWLDQGYKCVPVSVNVSRAHFIEKDLAEQILGMVDEAGCPHDLIEIELTESAFFDDKKAMIETIKKLKSYGFAVSMDDFGAGYSSLNSLKDMPLDVLKLDADFFRGEDAGERGDIVVAEAIKLAKSLHMRTVAEGVEDEKQVEFLKKQKCDMIQGYYYAKPMPKEDYTARMSR